MIVLKLLFLGALFIASNNNLHLNDNTEREVFFNYYASWISNLFHQATDITGYVVKFEWLPKAKKTYIKK